MFETKMIHDHNNLPHFSLILTVTISNMFPITLPSSAFKSYP